MPIHSDSRRFSFWDPLLLLVAVWILIQGLSGGGALQIMFGLGAGLYLFLTRHRRYDLFQDALVIRYWAPRRMVVWLADVQDVELVRLPAAGPALSIRRMAGGRLVITPTDLERFLDRMNAALGGTGSPGEA